MSENIQRKIARLLERAAHPGTEEHERSACMAKADRLMAEYKVERSTISWEHEDKTREPVHVERDAKIFSEDSLIIQSKKDVVEYQIQGTVTAMRGLLYRFAGCRVRENWANGHAVYHVFGYEEDIYYADFLWNMTFSEILHNLYPVWETTNSVGQNIYNLKNAGLSWSQVRVKAMSRNAEWKGVLIDEANAGTKLRSAYRAFAKSIGESGEMPKLRDPHHWRNSYVRGFSSRLSQRCAALKQDRQEFFDGQANLPALQKDSARVDDLFEEFFPKPVYTEEELAAAEERMRQADERAKKRRGRVAKAPRSRDADMSAWRAGVGSADRVQLSHSDSLKNKKEIG